MTCRMLGLRRRLIRVRDDRLIRRRSGSSLILAVLAGLLRHQRRAGHSNECENENRSIHPNLLLVNRECPFFDRPRQRQKVLERARTSRKKCPKTPQIHATGCVNYRPRPAFNGCLPRYESTQITAHAAYGQANSSATAELRLPAS